MLCKVHLNNIGVYLPRDSINGKVVCTFHDQQYIKAIKCSLQGKEFTNWNEHSEYRDVEYTARNVFLEDTISLGIGNNVIDPGTYEFPFGFKLPSSNIPSSYFHTYGSIKYVVSAKIYTPQSNVVEDEVEINVESPKIFDNRPLFPVSNQTEDENYFCCFPATPTILSVATQKDTFILGEVMKIRIELDNRYDVNATSINVQLVSIFQFFAKYPSPDYKYVQNVIAKASDVGVIAGGQKICEFNLRIPATIVIPNFDNCKLFKHWYSLNALATFQTNGVLNQNKLNISIDNIHLCYESSSPSAQRNLPAIGFLENVVPDIEVKSQPSVVPVAQAPSGLYPPRKNDPPYPVGEPFGHPVRPISLRSSTSNDSDLTATAPLLDDHKRPTTTILTNRQYNVANNSDGQFKEISPASYPSAPVSTAYPPSSHYKAPVYPPPPRHSNSIDNYSSNRNISPGYPPSTRPLITSSGYPPETSISDDYPPLRPNTVTPYPPSSRPISIDVSSSNSFTSFGYPPAPSPHNLNDYRTSASSTYSYQSNPTRISMNSTTRHSAINEQTGQHIRSRRSPSTLENIVPISAKAESPPPSYDEILKQPSFRSPRQTQQDSADKP